MTGTNAATEALKQNRSASRFGEVVRGRELCERLPSYSSPLGLYAEELDARSVRHLENLSQAFTHLALINAVMHVIREESGERGRRSRPADGRESTRTRADPRHPLRQRDDREDWRVPERAREEGCVGDEDVRR